jgi:2-polyprenyl-3-methyl-5-hydroxy-6-metoxy-1,4-benzoquinol methylase
VRAADGDVGSTVDVDRLTREVRVLLARQPRQQARQGLRSRRHAADTLASLLFQQTSLQISSWPLDHELMSDTHERAHAPATAPAEFWENRYAASDRIWSGRPNATLVEVVAPLRPGRALDLGCGEGADAIWLAQRGWRATGVDIAPSAIDRAQSAALEARLSDARIRFVVQDLAQWHPVERYDLVTASFLQSPVALPRGEVLRRAAATVDPGGHLFLITHAAPPSWATGPDIAGHRFLSPEEELAELALDATIWSTELAETRRRAITAPDGTPATLDDTVVLLRRL